MFNKFKKIISLMLVFVIAFSFATSAMATDIPKYTVVTRTDGGGHILINGSQFAPGTLVTVAAAANDGFIFYSWVSDDVVFSSQSSYTTTFVMPAKDVMIGARFAVKQAEVPSAISVTYETFGGTEFAPSYVTVGECVAAPENNPVKEGYVFDGWFTDTTCTLPFDFSAPVYNSTIVYAKWSAAETKPETTNAFGDVKTSDWYYECVSALADRNIISGMGNGRFEPQSNISRAQFATILANLSGEAFIESETPFADVPADSWYARAIAWAYSNGIVSGISADEFAPDKNISRQDMAVMLKRYVDNVAKVTLDETVAPSTFKDDASVDTYAKEAVYLMQRAGIIGGKPGNIFDPKANATRAEASKMIYVLLGILQ